MVNPEGDEPLTADRLRALFDEWTRDYAARRQIDRGETKDETPRGRDTGRER